MEKNKTHQQGQALITLLVFSVMALSIAGTASAIMINASRETIMSHQRNRAQMASESGIENALLRLIRNPDYAGETLQVGDISVVITVTGTTPKTITAVSTYENTEFISQATATYVQNQLTVTSWRTVY